MSFVHHTIVGHFDPATLRPFNVVAVKMLDRESVGTLLSQYPAEVARQVEFEEGYARCCWAPASRETANMVREFAYRLAEQEGCIAAELPLCAICYPESATAVQRRVFDEWTASQASRSIEHRA